MTKIKVSVIDPKTGKPRVGCFDSQEDVVKTSDNQTLAPEKIVKVFPKQEDKK